MSLVQRSVTSVTWNASANLLKVAILLARSIFLARLLPVETFGVYALATAVVTFSGILPKFGLGGAFLHRAPETSDEEAAAAVHFTLRLVLTTVWVAALVGLSLLLADGELRVALVVLTILYAGLFISDTARMVLVRRVHHRRLAILDLLNAMATTGVAVALALRGYQLTALLATDLVTLALTVVVLFFWQPVWRPRLLWLSEVVRYYLSFGRRTMAESALSEALDNLDDIWTGVYLGDHALGLYSRAFTFATYPRRLLAFPVFEVAGGTYAELKGDTHKLAQAFFRVNALLLRSGFLMGGLLVLIAPEFVRLLLGEKWLPMVTAFQLMFVYTLLDPIRVTVGQLFVAVGHPERLLRTRLAQLAILVVGLMTLGRWWGINGVAVVVNVMLVAGLIWLLYRSREFVSFSATRLFVPPAIALAGGALAALAALGLVCGRGGDSCQSDWLSMALKGGAFLVLYVGLLFLMERREMVRMAQVARRALFTRPNSPS